MIRSLQYYYCLFNEFFRYIQETDEKLRHVDFRVERRIPQSVDQRLRRNGAQRVSDGGQRSENDQLAGFVFVICEARRQNVVDHYVAVRCDRRVDTLQCERIFRHDSRFDQLTVAVDRHALTDGQFFGENRLAILTAAIRLVDQMASGQTQLVARFGGDLDERHRLVGVGVQPGQYGRHG